MKLVIRSVTFLAVVHTAALSPLMAQPYPDTQSRSTPAAVTPMRRSNPVTNAFYRLFGRERSNPVRGTNHPEPPNPNNPEVNDIPEMETDRPDFTESASTIPPGMVQIESGATYGRNGDEHSKSYGEVLVRAGLSETAELRVGVPTYSVVTGGGGSRESGLEDGSVGVKIALREGNTEHFDIADPKMAVIVDSSVPTGGKGFRESHLQPGAKLCMAWPITERLGLASNLNYAYPSSGGEQFHQGSASASLAYDLTEKVGLYVEDFVFSREDAKGQAINYVNGGITYALTKNHQIDARVGMATNGDQPNTFFGVGYAFRF